MPLQVVVCKTGRTRGSAPAATSSPSVSALSMLVAIGKDRMASNPDAEDLEKLIVIGALALLYFWMYQPRARTALKYLTKTLRVTP